MSEVKNDFFEEKTHLQSQASNDSSVVNNTKYNIFTRLSQLGITKEDYNSLLKNEDRYSAKDTDSNYGVNCRLAQNELSTLVQRDKEVRETLQAFPLIELGVGTDGILVTMAEIFKDLGVKHYVGIDKYALSQSSPDIIHSIFRDSMDAKEYDTFRKQFPELTEAISDDMLNTLLKLPDTYGNVVMGNIDQWIISSTDYTELLKGEITRIIPSKGLFISLGSTTFIEEEFFDKIPVNFRFLGDTLLEGAQSDFSNFKVFMKK